MNTGYQSPLVGVLVGQVGEGLNARDAADEAERKAMLSQADRRMLALSLIKAGIRRFDEERIGEGRVAVSDEEADDLTSAVMNRLFGLAGLQDHIDDAENTDIYVNGYDSVHLKRRDGSVVEAGPVAGSDQELIETIQRAARRGRHEQRWDLASPELNMQLPSGDRLHAIAWVSTRPSISIRRHNFDISRLKQLVDTGTINEALFHLLRAMVLARMNVIVAGGTGAGKTTLLRCLINEVPEAQRIVTIEDSLEIGLGHFAALHPNVVELEAREANLEGVGSVTMHDLVRSGLRMGPDRVIVGEIRGAEVVPMLLAMSQGNDGSMSTLHADSSAGVFPRIQMYMAMTPEGFDVEASNLMTANAVDMVVHITKLANNVRAVTSVREVTGADGDLVTSNEIFAPGADGRALPAFAMSERSLDRLVAHGFDRRWLDPDANRWSS